MIKTLAFLCKFPNKLCIEHVLVDWRWAQAHPIYIVDLWGLKVQDLSKTNQPTVNRPKLANVGRWPQRAKKNFNTNGSAVWPSVWISKNREKKKKRSIKPLILYILILFFLYIIIKYIKINFIHDTVSFLLRKKEKEKKEQYRLWNTT